MIKTDELAEEQRVENQKESMTGQRGMIGKPGHMPPEDMISQKVVTIKTVCSIKAFGILGVKLYNFQNTFHQLFWRYGNPDMHFLGTLKIEFLILDV